MFVISVNCCSLIKPRLYRVLTSSDVLRTWPVGFSGGVPNYAVAGEITGWRVLAAGRGRPMPVLRPATDHSDYHTAPNGEHPDTRI